MKNQHQNSCCTINAVFPWFGFTINAWFGALVWFYNKRRFSLVWSPIRLQTGAGDLPSNVLQICHQKMFFHIIYPFFSVVLSLFHGIHWKYQYIKGTVLFHKTNGTHQLYQVDVFPSRNLKGVAFFKTSKYSRSFLKFSVYLTELAALAAIFNLTTSIVVNHF